MQGQYIITNTLIFSAAFLATKYVNARRKQTEFDDYGSEAAERS